MNITPVDMKSGVGLTRKQKFFISGAVMLLLALIGLLVASTWQIKSKVDANQPYVTTIAPGSPGSKGDKGDRPTHEETVQAVDDWCKSTGQCEGKQPTYSMVFSAVQVYCSENTCRGSDGLPATETQIQMQIVAYCATGLCRGEKGDTGTSGINGGTGSDGLPGKDSPAVFFSCVIRRVETTPAVFVNKQFESWKYVTEPDTAYRDQYPIPDTQPCPSPLNLTGV